MCGIYGQINPKGADPKLIERMAKCLAHRGPDGAGEYHSGNTAIGAGRLAIIDLAAGPMPLFSEDRKVILVFNGEIYNYKSLRAELEKLDHTFATHTDSEVIVHGYEQWGTDVLKRLRGMFGIGIWDEHKQQLVLARDRMGEKPVYYTHHGDEFLFASEAKALFERPGLKRGVNREALAQYLMLGYVTAPLTLFEGIYKLRPGEFLIVKDKDVHRELYWEPTMNIEHDMTYQEAVSAVRAKLFECVEMRMMSDVPIGAFLSGGLDSSSVVAIMSGLIAPDRVNTFTMGYDLEPGSSSDTKFNVDARHALLVAQHLNAAHYPLAVDANYHLDTLFPYAIYGLDEPVAVHNMLNMMYISATARQHGIPVMLDGGGGDELFAGYSHLTSDSILQRYLGVPAFLRDSLLTPVLERLPGRFRQARSLAEKSHITDPTERFLLWEGQAGTNRLADLLADQALAGSALHIVRGVVAPLLELPTTDDFADRLAYARTRLWLADQSNTRGDRATMQMSVEGRLPYQDHEFVDLCFSIPLKHKLRNGGVKVVLKDAVADLLPRAILTRKKHGFFPPFGNWLREQLLPLVNEHLGPERVNAVGIFNADGVSKLVDEHLSGRATHRAMIQSLLMFQVWHALYIDQSLAPPGRLMPEDIMPERAAIGAAR